MKNASEFSEWRSARIQHLAQTKDFEEISLQWMDKAIENDYPYLFQWLGVPVIQFPSDLLLIQEAIFRSQANKVIEIGIARGGTTIFLASLLKLMHGDKEFSVIGLDIKLSSHTVQAVRSSIVQDRIILVEGDSVNNETLLSVKQHIGPGDKVLVILDSNHTHQHVYREMVMYGDLVTSNSFLIVMDTAIEYINQANLGNREWGKGNSPLTAVAKFQANKEQQFVLDEYLDKRGIPGASKGGFLRKK